MTNYLSLQMPFSNGMNIATCLETPTSWGNPQDTALQQEGITPEDCVTVTQIYETFRSNEQIIKKRCEGKRRMLTKRKSIGRKQCSLVKNTINGNQNLSKCCRGLSTCETDVWKEYQGKTKNCFEFPECTVDTFKLRILQVLGNQNFNGKKLPR